MSKKLSKRTAGKVVDLFEALALSAGEPRALDRRFRRLSLVWLERRGL